MIRVHYGHYLDNLMKKHKTFKSRIQKPLKLQKKIGHINSNVIFITILTPMSTWLTLGWSSCISLVAWEKPFDDKPWFDYIRSVNVTKLKVWPHITFFCALGSSILQGHQNIKYIGGDWSLVFLLISNLSNGLSLHQFLSTKTTEANKSLKTDANGTH